MSKEPRQESIQVNPIDIGLKPVTTPKGTIPGKKGSIACMPCMKQDPSCLDCFKFMLGRYNKSKKTQETGKGSTKTIPTDAVDNYGGLFLATTLSI